MLRALHAEPDELSAGAQKICAGRQSRATMTEFL
jgi:hypothetical protein